MLEVNLSKVLGFVLGEDGTLIPFGLWRINRRENDIRQHHDLSFIKQVEENPKFLQYCEAYSIPYRKMDLNCLSKRLVSLVAHHMIVFLNSSETIKNQSFRIFMPEESLTEDEQQVLDELEGQLCEFKSSIVHVVDKEGNQVGNELTWEQYQFRKKTKQKILELI